MSRTSTPCKRPPALGPPNPISLTNPLLPRIYRSTTSDLHMGSAGKVPVGMRSHLSSKVDDGSFGQALESTSSRLWNPQLLVIAMAALNALAERHLPRSSIRSVRMTGALFKSATFRMLNRRVVLEHKGVTNLVEGSVLISVNGLSTVSMPGDRIIKFVADLPR